MQKYYYYTRSRVYAMKKILRFLFKTKRKLTILCDNNVVTKGV